MKTCSRNGGDATSMVVVDSAAATPTSHPIVAFVERLDTVLDSLMDVPAWSMSRDEQRAVLLRLTRQRSRLEELRLRVLAAADRDDVARRRRPRRRPLGWRTRPTSPLSRRTRM